jgi:hypothetical protein
VPRSYLEVPPDWEPVATRHILGFVTSETFRRPDGTTVTWRSRAHRKRGRGPIQGSTLWAPHALAWWIAVLFMVGSACFVVGPMPGYLAWVGYRADAITFFVGSIFFTSAALCQYIEVAVTPRSLTRTGPHHLRRRAAVEIRRIDWWAASVQLLGTLFFNVTTFAAVHTDFTVTEARRRIWTPDALGSICFLVASWLAYAEVGHRLISWLPHLRSWRIAALNLLGSVAFGVSAVASFTLPTTGEPANVLLTNLGTFVGAICFFVGAALLLPERTHPDA